MNGALDAVFPRPCDHAASGGAVFHAAQADFSEKFHARGSEFLEVVFDHALLEDRSARVDLYSTGTICLKGTLREDGHCLQSNDIFRASGSVHLACRDHCGDASVHVAVDQPGSECGALSVDRGGCGAEVDVFLFSDGLNFAVDRDHCVGIKERMIEVAAKKQSDIADDQLAGSRGCCRIVAHGVLPEMNKPTNHTRRFYVGEATTWRSDVARPVVRVEIIMLGSAFSRKDANGLARLCILGSRCAKRLHAAGRKFVCSRGREVASKYSATHRCGAPRESLLGLARMLPQAG